MTQNLIGKMELIRRVAGRQAGRGNVNGGIVTFVCFLIPELNE